ncbi:MAG TPA: N-acetyl-gamma-glutamyl-phosphate reductase [Firmicutes bacterium]|nr:N-acetyl-gamma-glutamyl-phosphate reductase [Bacillota bacterium]
MAIKVALAGATGYAGTELTRLLYCHPDIELVSLAAGRREGEKLVVINPQFHGLRYEAFIGLEDLLATEAELIFLALPHGHAMEIVPNLLAAGRRVIDLSADYRLQDVQTFAAWYGKEHCGSEALAQAVYGLPELQDVDWATVRLVANPGCYPTAILLGLAPFLQAGLVKTEGIIVDAKSGVSGAGRSPKLEMLYSEVNENVRAYGVGGVHRHLPEIEQEVSRWTGLDCTITFTPHLIPMTRGILATIYLTPNHTIGTADALQVLERFYQGCPFVHVLPPGSLPNTKAVFGSNHCQLGAVVDGRTGRLIVISVIDNLGKGAAGQAVQNMNLMCGWPEEMGLATPGLFP